MTVTAPAVATLGATESIVLDWTGLAAGTRYLGSVSYGNGAVEIGQTMVAVAT
jgi:hypothetical protein